MQDVTRFTIYVPLRGNDGAEILPPLTKTAAETLAEEFGGATIGATFRGSWRNANGELVRDDIAPVFVDVDPGDVSAGAYVRGVALTVKALARQESVYVTRETLAREFV